MIHDIHYQKVKLFYGDQRAKRSGQLYMRHIDQGLEILDHINASVFAKQAFCLHPLVQKDEDLERVIQWGSLNKCSPTIVAIAMEYRRVANSYLSRHNLTTEVNLGPLDDVRKMLIADKIQNYRDLLLHNTNHPRYDRLVKYFNSWMAILHINKYMYDEITSRLDP